MPKPVNHVATTDISQLMNPGPERRMDLPGFDAEFVDFPHYIVRITERIWHDRDVELCLKYYAEDCAIHTMAGDISGAQTVVDNTWATLKAFPDRRLDADNVIWSAESENAFYSSHLITSKMTNEGDSEFGKATGKQLRIQTIADCLCKDNRVIEEWLVRDNLGAVLQLGFDPKSVARTQAQTDHANGFNLLEFHTSNRAKTKAGDQVSAQTGTAAAIAIAALKASLLTRDRKAMTALYDYRVDAKYPGASELYGPDQIASWLAPLWSSFSEVSLSIEHIAEIPYLGSARDVAIRWSLSASHTGDGRYGPPTDADIYILGVSQFRVINNRVREEVCIWDDLALLRQVKTARHPA